MVEGTKLGAVEVGSDTLYTSLYTGALQPQRSLYIAAQGEMGLLLEVPGLEDWVYKGAAVTDVITFFHDRFDSVTILVLSDDFGNEAKVWVVLNERNVKMLARAAMMRRIWMTRELAEDGFNLEVVEFPLGYGPHAPATKLRYGLRLTDHIA